jgi:hypothetical protein
MRKLILLLVIGTTLSVACSKSGDGASSAGSDSQAAMAMTATDALGPMQKSAASLGQTQLTGSFSDAIKPYIESMNSAAQLVVRKGRELKKTQDSNVFIYGTLNLATYKAWEAAGSINKSSPDREAGTLKAVLDKAAENKVGALDASDLTREVGRLFEFLGQVVFLGDKGITDQLLPADSAIRKSWDTDGDGRLEVPLPPIASNAEADAWSAFQKALEAETDARSPIGVARLEIVQRADNIVLS